MPTTKRRTKRKQRGGNKKAEMLRKQRGGGKRKKQTGAGFVGDSYQFLDRNKGKIITGVALAGLSVLGGLASNRNSFLNEVKAEPQYIQMTYDTPVAGLMMPPLNPYY